MIDNRQVSFPKRYQTCGTSHTDVLVLGADGLILLKMTIRQILKWFITILTEINLLCAVTAEGVLATSQIFKVIDNETTFIADGLHMLQFWTTELFRYK
jgi:hypothetical protein